MAINVLADHIAREYPIGGFEPQRQHNWTLELHGLPGNESDLVSLSLHQGFLPVCTNEDVEIPFGNERVWVAGRANWEMGQVIVKDFVDRPVAAALYRWRKLVYNPTNGSIGFAVRYKRRASIVLFGPDGTGQREWELTGCWPTAINFAQNGLDMASSQQVFIDLRLRYDKAFAAFTGERQGGTLSQGILSAIGLG